MVHVPIYHIRFRVSWDMCPIQPKFGMGKWDMYHTHWVLPSQNMTLDMYHIQPMCGIKHVPYQATLLQGTCSISSQSVTYDILPYLAKVWHRICTYPAKVWHGICTIISGQSVALVMYHIQPSVDTHTTTICCSRHSFIGFPVLQLSQL